MKTNLLLQEEDTLYLSICMNVYCVQCTVVEHTLIISWRDNVIFHFQVDNKLRFSLNFFSYMLYCYIELTILNAIIIYLMLLLSLVLLLLLLVMLSSIDDRPDHVSLYDMRLKYWRPQPVVRQSHNSVSFFNRNGTFIIEKFIERNLIIWTVGMRFFCFSWKFFFV